MRAGGGLIALWCVHAFVTVLEAQDERRTAGGAAPDSAFLLATEDPGRSPSPFIGNGRVGVVIPPLGIGATMSVLAGLYDEAPGDVPRIVAVPAWNAIALGDGGRWLDSAAPADGSIRAYRQALDMRTGTAHTSHDWVQGTRRTSIRVETFVSRAEPRVAAVRLEVVPHQVGRLRLRFALAGRATPAGSRAKDSPSSARPPTSG